MGITCLVCDPPRAEKEGDAGFVDMQAISRADIVTVHVPLVTQGRHPTLGLLDDSFISQLNPGSTLINTSRGDVMDGQALKQRLIQQADLNTVLDVWENEPAIDAELVALTSIATPHIAGYSTDGKLRATGRLHDAYSHFIKQQPVWNYRQVLPVPAEPIITLQDGEVTEVISEALSKVYGITRDDATLRFLFEDVSADAAVGFDQLRKQYPVRRECSAYGVRGEMLSASVRSALQVFGFGLI
jgi:erythronate-4-phosphate dehydrogenase